jgi:hypothetical protein
MKAGTTDGSGWDHRYKNALLTKSKLAHGGGSIGLWLCSFTESILSISFQDARSYFSRRSQILKNPVADAVSVTEIIALLETAPKKRHLFR